MKFDSDLAEGMVPSSAQIRPDPVPSKKKERLSGFQEGSERQRHQQVHRRRALFSSMTWRRNPDTFAFHLLRRPPFMPSFRPGRRACMKRLPFHFSLMAPAVAHGRFLFRDSPVQPLEFTANMGHHVTDSFVVWCRTPPDRTEFQARRIRLTERSTWGYAGWQQTTSVPPG